MSQFRNWLDEDYINESLTFSAQGKSPVDLLDISIKSVKEIPERLNELDKIKDYEKAKKEAKKICDNIEEFYHKYIK